MWLLFKFKLRKSDRPLNSPVGNDLRWFLLSPIERNADNPLKISLGKVTNSLLPRSRCLKLFKSLNNACGNDFSWFWLRSNDINLGKPVKSPLRSSCSSELLIDSVLILTRCATVTSWHRDAPRTSRIIAFTTFHVLPLSGLDPHEATGSNTGIGVGVGVGVLVAVGVGVWV